MAAITRVKYLTAKDWKANKGLFTKTVTAATGMGKALETLDGLWTKVPWGDVEPDEATKNLTVRGFDSTYTVANVDLIKKGAQQHAAQIIAVEVQLRAVEKLARDEGAKWKANKLVPASSVAYIGQVQIAAHTLLDRLDKLEAGWTRRREAAAVSEKLIWGKLNSQIESRIILLRAAAHAVGTMTLAVDQATLVAIQKMYEAHRELIPLVEISHAPADQALHRRLKAEPQNDLPFDWAKLEKKPALAPPVFDELREKAGRLEEAVHGM